MGFAQGNDAESNYDRMKQKVNDELKRHFRPEFLNRIDDVVVFHQLTTDEINQMVNLMLKRVEGALRNKDMALEVTDRARALLGERGFDPVLGARPLRRTIQREVEDALSEKILFDELRPGQIILIDVEGEGADATLTFRGEPKPSPVPETVGAGAVAGESGGAAKAV
jgi:ATP-dependent Clp protease ATP-binding subunit ClpC